MNVDDGGVPTQSAVLRLGGFSDRVAVVTGAGRGIGRAIADALLSQGSRTAYLDLEEAPDVEAIRSHPSAMFVQCDVSDEASVDRAFGQIESEWGKAAILVNNAGVLWQATVEDTDLAMWERTFAVNTTGVFLCCRRALPGMRHAGYGRIVTIGSSAGKTGGAKALAAYAASKAAVMALAKSIASECASDGITSNALAPALIDTDMISGLSDLADRIPVGRLGSTQDVAAAVLFLASEHASYITAEVMDVNGGFLID